MTTINCATNLIQWNGTAALQDNGDPWKFGQFLAMQIAVSGVVEPKESVVATVLAYRLHNESDIKLTASESVLILKVAEHAVLQPWARAAIQYLVDPDSLSDKQRLTLDKLYTTEHKGAGEDATPENGAGHPV